MSYFRLDKNGHARGVRCDGCGKFSNNDDGSYIKSREPLTYGRIRGGGRDCPHDHCDDCRVLDPNGSIDMDDCPTCGCPIATEANEERLKEWKANMEAQAG